MPFFTKRHGYQESLAGQLERLMLKPKKILIVDDNEIFLAFMLKFVATRFVADVAVASSVKNARLSLDEHRFDVAILDLKLTNGSGLELYQEILQKCPQTAVIFLTAFDLPEHRNEIEALGPARVYGKESMLREGFVEILLQHLNIRKREPTQTAVTA